MACKITVLQHAASETLGSIGDVLEARSFKAQVISSYAGEPVPRQIGQAAGLIVLGGPMGVSEQGRYPFLTEEMHLIGDALSHGVPVLGICLGAQLLAHTLGAEVYKAEHAEIGWHPLRLTEEARHDRLWAEVSSPCMAFHWHGDAFALPPGAVSLASSALTPCQIFRFGENAYGLQCHMEITALLIENWIRSFQNELVDAGADASEIRSQTRQELSPLLCTAQAVFGSWASLLMLNADAA